MVADLSLFAIAWFGPGVMRAIQGENGAATLTETIFRRRGAVQKKVLEPCADGEGFHL
jgi:hypothetical protein